jgi:predicted nucleic acid-binding protein
MNLLFDTNILIYLAWYYSLKLLQRVNPNNDKIFISVATVAELKSIALQNGWGAKKWGWLMFYSTRCWLLKLMKISLKLMLRLTPMLNVKIHLLMIIRILPVIWAKMIFGLHPRPLYLV